ncbi:ABC transporter ATP-binding protein [Chelativorans intermedius]|uniref:ABC transporter ATP-binding protein n=1 Tax=Chelativorans intermedius TaxID=515947 RepID=A0ABV6D2G1_9HYPH|nr:sn-glycerol-3-phosphate ABC transporter ATP-binding protein UgpC [Chelativorans intermedius]MCT8997359.1 sn-glycerol-3-phosphate ABC transporter ATP-binding protein UgpC [Chelativorans intermedius]
MATIELKDVFKSYGGVEVIHGVSLDIADHEFMVFVGPSGCGKSTLLRMVAGLETITDGRVLIGDRLVNSLEPRHRDIAMVFQDYALYPHMTVRENMAFGLRMRKAPDSEVEKRLAEAADILQISSLLDRKPGQLSGGQRQRVAMGRAIVRRPSAFLFDEPLSNLDAKLRVDMRTQIKRLHALLRTTTIYVTHDQVEAMTLADRITVLRNGHIEQVGTPFEVYERPANLFVAEFIGSPAMNMLKARYVAEGGKVEAVIKDDLRIKVPPHQIQSGTDVVLGIRPEHLEPSQFRAHGDSTTFTATTKILEPLGSDVMVLCDLAGMELTARLTPGRVSRAGECVDLVFDTANIHLFELQSGRRVEALAREPA